VELNLHACMVLHFEFFVTCYRNMSGKFIRTVHQFESQFGICKAKTLYFMVVRIATKILCR